MTKITTQNYWEEYYSNTQTQRKNIEQVVSVYDKYWEVLIKSNNANPPKTIIEIGGYPGRYLAYLADKYHLTPTSLDFNSDKIKIEESMQAFNVKNFNIIQADIFNYEPENKYDIVISNGFIEHFDNYNEVLDKHMLYLKKGGTMLIMIPNMKGYIKFYKSFVDKENLKTHTLKCMNFKVFKSFALRNNLKIFKCEYFGGFPFSVHQKLNLFQKIIYQFHRFLSKKLLNKFLINNPNILSSSIVVIFKN